MKAYITSTGSYLPGPAVNNDEIEDVLGLINDRPSKLKKRILKANGIKTRHYAIDKEHKTLFNNSTMAAHAGNICLDKVGFSKTRLGMLSCATTQGDLVIPGFASMVQAELELPDVEIHSSHGVCSSSLMAVKTAMNNVLLQEQDSALVIASELASRLFKNTRYEAAGADANLDFNAEFLRWMLSDGAGAMLIQSQPTKHCLQIDWIKSFSHADTLPVCMSVGMPSEKSDTRTWQDFPNYSEAEKAGAILIRQDVRLLEHAVKLGVDGALRLMEKGILDLPNIDHVLCHYSSHHFKEKIFQMLETAGASIPEERWYTNLYERGNTGCASIFIMLDEFLKTKSIKNGDKILCMVPESGRFNNAYMQLTVVSEQ